MLLLIGLGLFFLAMVVAAALLEAWARHRHWPGYDDRPVRFAERRMGRPW